MVGARSAVFAPLPALGLVIVDEEHEPAYKQSEQIRYHGRDTALVRARLANAVAVLGSATPSLESWANAERGKLRRLRLPERIDGRPLPVVELVDLNERPKDDRALFSAALLDGLGGALARGEQALVFLNRRGHTRVVECEDCGEVSSCPSCDVALTWHSSDGTFRCHYCDRVEPARPACAKCGSPFFKHRGSGTQKAEKELKAHFPEARVLRLDSDSAKPRGAQGDILAAFGRREADVLLGTQMIAKGLDFHGVTFVGVVSADGSLHLPDFRSGERTFQSIVQVAGRAGRGKQPGARDRPDARARTSEPHRRAGARLRRLRGARGLVPPRPRLPAVRPPGRADVLGQRRGEGDRRARSWPLPPCARRATPGRRRPASAAPHPRARSSCWAPRPRRCRSCATGTAGG